MRKLLLAVSFLCMSIPLASAPSFGATPNPPASEIDDELETGTDAESPSKVGKDETDKKKEPPLRPIPPFKMVYIKGGCFEMGDFSDSGDEDEKPLHEVCVADFYLLETEVTQELFDSVMNVDYSKPKDPQKPVNYVSWFSADKFIKRLNARNLADKKKTYYRFPTEAEWEYAARSGGRKDKWSGVNNEAALGDYSWYIDSIDEGMMQVKKKKPNALGLYDMSGNLSEWVDDYFAFDYYLDSPKDDPMGPDMSVWKVVRGGAFKDDSNRLRTTYRYAVEPTNRSPFIGFRLAE
ncbi:MAG: SUMF1/EgtB/PvdO family nonheme iron enzyme [Deltaproteobacteria bacterium]